MVGSGVVVVVVGSGVVEVVGSGVVVVTELALPSPMIVPPKTRK